MAGKEKKQISRACADKINIMQYVELDDYVVAWPRRSEANPSVETCYRIDKETGEVTEFTVEDARIFRWTECVGAGRYIYVLKQDLLQIARIDMDTLEESQIGVTGSFPHHMILTDKYLYYSTKVEHAMIVRVDLSTLKSAGMDTVGEYLNLREDAWTVCGDMFYGMHDDFDREISTFYSINMETFDAGRLSETPFSLERFWEKSELLKEDCTGQIGNCLCTVVAQSRHADSYYELMDLTHPGPVKRKKLAGPMTYIWQAGEKLYLAAMEGDMTISVADPLTGEKTVLAEQTECFAKDEFGHIEGDRPQVVGQWLYYRDAKTGEIVTTELQTYHSSTVKQ